MAYLPNQFKKLFFKKALRVFNRKYSTLKDKSSNSVRQKFLDYFIGGRGHMFVRSSPVVPFCDPTIAFVNAGMNQFKGIFLDRQTSPYRTVANSQKCVRVGGKHNDLNLVGRDGYHHTFFEMLGNWSFGDYFKKEACQMAWELLTGPYKLDPSRLYVTYFAGDPALGLEPDSECLDVWKSLGLPDDRIAATRDDNFWEMGPAGPCGPCTEIHVRGTGGGSDLMELWNIVFIQYNRKADGTISPLSKQHVDTGMGLERLTAVLQDKTSNYDTDIFTDLFAVIHKNCHGLPEYSGSFGADSDIDTNYRILADHSRMITVALADGMFPDDNQKLRRIIRRVFSLEENVFKNELLEELTKTMAEKLGETYPELRRNINKVNDIIQYEKEVYRMLRSSATAEWLKLVETEPKLANLNITEMPNLISAYKELKGVERITSQLAFKLYDTFGLDEASIEELAQTLNLSADMDGFRKKLNSARMRSKSALTYGSIIDAFRGTIPLTEDLHKYDYKYENGNYVFKDLEVRLLGIIGGNETKTSVRSEEECSLIFDRSNFYTESGGQMPDTGEFQSGEVCFKVMEAENVNGYVLHKGKVVSGSLKTGTVGVLKVDGRRRLKTMCNHTAAHLFNAALRTVSQRAMCQKSSRVSSDWLNLDVGVYGKKLVVDEVKNAETLVRSMINEKVDVRTKVINSQQLLGLEDVTLVPGEVYPETGIRIVEAAGKDLVSREACCGTHVQNTSDIKEFCVVTFRSLGRSVISLYAVSGDRAAEAVKNGQEMSEKVERLRQQIDTNSDSPEVYDGMVTELKQSLNFNIGDKYILPVYVKTHCLEVLNGLSKRLRSTVKGTLGDFIEMEMQSVKETQYCRTKSDKPYIVHFLGCSSILDSVPLQKATRVCPDMPVLVISYTNGNVKARCCVPEAVKTERFNATSWLEVVGAVFRSACVPPKGQDGGLVCNMKTRKVNRKDWDQLLNDACTSAKDYADERL